MEGMALKNNAIGKIALLTLFSATVAVGCQRDQNAPPAPSQPATPPAPAVVAQPAPAVVAPPVSDNRPAATIGASSAAATSSSGENPILRDVRSGKQPAADRLVFEFDTGGLPAWKVEYVDRPVRDCGSGEAVPVAGDAWLQIRFAGAQAHTEQGASTSGPRRRPLAQTVAQELVRTCDFEGEVTWVVGVARPNPYKILALSGPSRLVIDIAH
jgi:hypothetical protein